MRSILTICVGAMCATGASPRVAAAQLFIMPVSCATVPEHSGMYGVWYGGKAWQFDLILDLASAIVPYSGIYYAWPDPAISFFPDDQGRYLKWTNSGGRADCELHTLVLPTRTESEYFVTFTNLYGQFAYIGGGGGGGSECDSQLIYDPTANCDGPAGGAVPSPGYNNPPLGGSSLCSTLKLDPGCYAVYVDDVYDSTVCC